MKVADIINLNEKLEEYNIPMREKIELFIDKDDASELLIDMLAKGYIFEHSNQRLAERYINAGIAYRYINGIRAMIFGMRINVR